MADKHNLGGRLKQAFAKIQRLGVAGVFLAMFMLIGGYAAYKFTSAHHSSAVNIYANNVEFNTTVNTNSSLIIRWETLKNTGGYGCYSQGTWGDNRQLSDGYYPASGTENRSGDTATAGTKRYGIYCITDEGPIEAWVAVSVVAPPPAPVVSLSLNGQAANISLTQGSSLTLNWSATNSPTNCTASWQSNPGASGTANRTADTATTGVKTYTYSCTNPGGTGSISRSATVAPGSSPTPTLRPNPTGTSPTPPPRPTPSPTPTGTSPTPTFSIESSTEPGNGLDLLDITVSHQAYTSATLSWKTGIAAKGTVEYAIDPAFTDAHKQDVNESKTDQTVQLGGLAPGKRYYFRITLSAADKTTSREGEFDTKGLPVMIKIVDRAQKAVPKAEVTVGEQVQTTDDVGNAYFELPAGPHTATVKVGKNTKQFDLTVEEKPITDSQTPPEQQSFMFVMPRAGGLNLVKLFGIFAAIGTLFGAVRLIKRRRSGSSLWGGGISASQQQPHDHHKKKKHSENMVATAPPPIAVPPPITPDQMSMTADGHHIPDWQQALRQDLKQPHKPVEEMPKDMFETAEEQYHYDEKFKKPPAKQ